MSNSVRWTFAILLFCIGIFAAVISLAFLGFFTWECHGPANTTAYSILYVAAIISIIGGIAPAVMLIRRTAGQLVGAAIALGALFTLTSNGVFIYYTTNIC